MKKIAFVLLFSLFACSAKAATLAQTIAKLKIEIEYAMAMMETNTPHPVTGGYGGDPFMNVATQNSVSSNRGGLVDLLAAMQSTNPAPTQQEIDTAYQVAQAAANVHRGIISEHDLYGKIKEGIDHRQHLLRGYRAAAVAMMTYVYSNYTGTAAQTMLYQLNVTLIAIDKEGDKLDAMDADYQNPANGLSRFEDVRALFTEANGYYGAADNVWHNNIEANPNGWFDGTIFEMGYFDVWAPYPTMGGPHPNSYND